MPPITVRTRITVRTGTRGYLADADARAARRTIAGITPGTPVDLHITGQITGIGPWALHPLGDLLADASEVTIITDTPAAAAALTRAVEAAIGAEHEIRPTTRAGGAR